MPTLDAFIPDGALSPRAEAQLMKELTDILTCLVGFDPDNEGARSGSVIFLHRPTVYAGGALATAPHFRFILPLPEGDDEDDVRRLVVKAVSEAVARAVRGNSDGPRLVDCLVNRE